MGRFINLKFVFGGVLFLFIYFSAYSQIDQPLRFSFKGKLADMDNGNPIAFGYIYNVNLKIGAISDTSGVFSISARYNDILLISSIGYYSKNVQVTDTLMRHVFVPYIFLKEKIYELKQVNIHFLGTYQDFKYRVLHTKIPDNGMAKINEKLRKELEKEPSQPLQSQASIPLGSPITALYMLFSKEGKQLRKLEDALEEENEQKIIAPKYNREVIAKATGLSGAELDDFILYCQPDKSILLKSDEFQIYYLIQNYFEKYKQTLRSDSAAKANKIR